GERSRGIRKERSWSHADRHGWRRCRGVHETPQSRRLQYLTGPSHVRRLRYAAIFGGSRSGRRGASARCHRRTCPERCWLLEARSVVSADNRFFEVAKLCLAIDQRQNDRVALVRRAELALDVLDVDANRVRADRELLSHFFFGEALAAEHETV